MRAGGEEEEEQRRPPGSEDHVPRTGRSGHGHGVTTSTASYRSHEPEGIVRGGGLVGGQHQHLGQVDFAIGVAGMSSFRDYRGEQDMMGHTLHVTNIAVVDELAAAAELVKGKAEGVPVVLIRGYDYPEGDGRASDLIRPLEEDLFR